MMDVEVAKLLLSLSNVFLIYLMIRYFLITSKQVGE